MTQLDKLIQLLRHGSLSTEDICLQLGVEWDNIKETIGIMRMRCWLVSVPRGDLSRGKDRLFILTSKGKEEFNRRIDEANKRNKCKHMWYRVYSSSLNNSRQCSLCGKEEKDPNPKIRIAT